MRDSSRNRLQRALQLIESGDVTAAEEQLIVALAESPGHPELMHGLGALQLRRGYMEQAVTTLTAASADLPGKVPLLLALAAALAASNRHAEAVAALGEAAAHATDVRDWLSIGIFADREGYSELAGRAAGRTLALDRGNAQALLLRARSAQILGRIDSAARDYRVATTHSRVAARAWFALADLKTVKLEPTELSTLKRAAKRSESTLEDRTMLAFALGKGLEDAGEWAQAFTTFQQANELVRMQGFWNAAAFSAQVDQVVDAFATPTPATPQKETSTAQGEFGKEVIFLVGLPRSGTTLIEQVLAAHPKVEGASELPYLNTVITTESKRLRQPFPHWAAHATSDDWRRLGSEYLRLSARWRAERPIATDKLPENWLLAGAALSMLPGARVIDCRRDALETCWSCYKQLFAPGRVGFAYDFGSLAAYWHDYVRASGNWQARFPGQYRLQQYEGFLADPETQTRLLLEFCSLEFDSACLRFHEAQRGVRSASAAQVRQPLRRDTARTAAYGELLDPLRRLLSPSA